MTNDEKMAHNIVKEVSTIPNLLEYEAMTLCATKMAECKDEQYKKEKQQLIKKANEAVNQGFENGAKFMKQQLIDKACEWINDNYFEYLQPIGYNEQLKDSIDINAFVNDLIKAMNKE